ncbi:alpha/beta hydrolase [Streptomyces gobiensis]|uniref:alpha/beta hydrolase n=1 Tax=Streptomyces gobiensis TaxID=2875706 RepID=UPI001E5579F0|nr:alpha/beta hydrolase [Streptomyces gobiensis]UGY93507.1 alpha/beta hydrolase [Streptomyces gobiensis]
MSAAAQRTRALAAVAILTVGAVAGCGGSGGEEAKQTASHPPYASPTAALPGKLTGQKLKWAGCQKDPEFEEGADGTPEPMPGGVPWECATLKVPLDYAKPDGDTMDIAMIRARTKAKGKDRIGSLIFNFGGPGGSGVATLPAAGQDYEKLNKRYDLVSFDPRGVGRSEGVRCLSDKELDEYYQSARLPQNDAEARETLDEQRKYARACEKNSGKVLPYLTTANTARDMDLMREVLGDEKMHYFGISYGTELGGVYAHLFPARISRAVFDAVVDPTQTPAESNLGQAKGFQRALTNYLEACHDDGQCPVGQTPAKGEKEIADLLERLDKKPLKTRDPDGRELNGSLAASGVALSLYSQDFWQLLTEGLQEAMNDNDGTMLLRLSDLLNGRREDGTYDNSQAALTAISCADDKQRYTLADIKRRLPEFEKASPVFGQLTAWGMAQCHGWPFKGETDRPRVSAEGAEPIVVIGNTGDPATPYEGAAKMAKQLGEDVGVELTYEGEGHGAYNSGDRCVRRHVNDYLLGGKVPADGSTCES